MAGSNIPEPVTAVTDLAGSWLPLGLQEVEQRLREIVAAAGGLAPEAESTLAAGGKRMRPLLVLLCAGRPAQEGGIRAATAVELVHMATLVHDDVLDSAPLRRGRPTVVAAAGRGRALATGDLLLSRAFAELLPSPEAESQVMALAGASVSLARGELAQRQDAFRTDVSAERYLQRCRLKTAALFECACVIGRERPAAARVALERFGGEIGLAFQLLDDVLDVVGPSERTGKARGTDLLDGTVTLPMIRAGERDPELKSIDLHALDGAAAEGLCDRIAASGATEAVRGEARDRVERAKQGLREAPIEHVDQKLFELVADGVVERYS